MLRACEDKLGSHEIPALTNLSCDVAITVLPAALAQHRLARFERKTKVLAAMNHANISIIHDLKSTATNAISEEEA